MIANIAKSVFGLAGKVLKFGVVAAIGAVGAVAAHDYLASRKLEGDQE